MTYKKAFLSIIICSQLVIQPMEKSQNSLSEEKNTQSPSWFTWRNLGIAAAFVVGVPLLVRRYIDQYKFLKKDNIKKKEIVYVQGKSENIQEFLETLNGPQKNKYGEYKERYTDYLKSKDKDGHNLFESLEKEPKNHQPSEWENEWKNEEKVILAKEGTFKKFLTLLTKNEEIIEADGNISKLYETIKNYWVLLYALKHQLSVPGHLQDEVNKNVNATSQGVTQIESEGSETKKLSDEDLKKRYFDAALPNYTKSFLENRNTVYKIFNNQKKNDLNNPSHPYNNQNEYPYLDGGTKKFIDNYLKYYEPTKLLAIHNSENKLNNKTVKNQPSPIATFDPKRIGFSDIIENSSLRESVKDITIQSNQSKIEKLNSYLPSDSSKKQGSIEDIASMVNLGTNNDTSKPKESSDSLSEKSYIISPETLPVGYKRLPDYN